MRRHLTALLIVTALVGVGPQPALSQSTLSQSTQAGDGRYQERILRLSEVLGHLHHLRGSCQRGEGQLWRDNMMELVRLEDPPDTRKNAMVAAFNASFEASRKAFPDCGRNAGREARRLAQEGARISSALSGQVAR